LFAESIESSDFFPQDKAVFYALLMSIGEARMFFCPD
jgi:hypothetical protein